MARTQLNRLEPILAVPDVRAAVAYYEQKLGFSDSWLWGEPPVHAGVLWHKVGMQFSYREDFVAIGAEFYLNASELDALYERHCEAGVEIVQELEAKPWGMREYTVRDLNGYRLRFGEPHRATQPKGEAVEVRLEARLPTITEYERLLRAVGWASQPNFETWTVALRAPVYSVVALHEDEVIGCALLLGDSVSFLYVKDVMVDPRFQRQGIGSRLMENLMTWAETNAPDRTLVGLFTGAGLTGFYERFGFTGPESLVGMTRVVRRPSIEG